MFYRIQLVFNIASNIQVDAVPLTPDLIVSRAKCSVGELDIYMASLAISFADAEKAERMQVRQALS